MITLLIYLDNNKKPIEVYFESQKGVEKFYDSLQSDATIIRVGQVIFQKSTFKYCLQK